ncbi:MAG: hypothetical protein ACT4OM_10150 [Actinomycetota bacterium]
MESPESGSRLGANVDRLLMAFAQSIHAKLRALRTLDLTPKQKARLLEAISDDIKKCTNFLVPEASRAALDRASSLGVQLSGQTWHDQHKFDPGRTIFHFEHMVPVSAIREACLKETSDQAIQAILKNRLRVVWILKDEDKELTRLGYRSNRLDPASSYLEAGIELVEPRVDL